MNDATTAVTRSKGRILIVDDEANARSALADLLAEEGYLIEVAPNGFKALDRMTAFAPDLVLTDLKMPGMDGVQLAEQIRKSDAELPVVVMSAFGDPQTASATIQAGARNFLTKPVNLTLLTAVVAEELEHRRRRLGNGGLS